MSITLNQPNLPAIVNRYYADMLLNLTDQNIYDQSRYAIGLKSPKMGPVLNAAVPQTNVGASLALGTYFYVVAATFADNRDSMASLEVSSVLTGTKNSAALKWATVPGATGYKVYRATASGQYANTLIQTIVGGAISTFLDTGYLVQTGTPVAFQLQIKGQVTPAGTYQVNVFLSSQGKQAKQIDTIGTDATGKFAFDFSPQGGTSEVYVTVSGQGRSASVYVNAYNIHLFLEMIAEEMLNNWQETIRRSWITPQLYPGRDLFSSATIQSSDIDFQNAWGVLTSVVNDASIANQYRALVQAMVLSYRKATTLDALLDVFNQFQTATDLHWIVFYDVDNTAFRLGNGALKFSVTRSGPSVPSLTFEWNGGLVSFNKKQAYLPDGSYTISGSILPRYVFVYVDGTLDANGYLKWWIDPEISLGHNLAPQHLAENVKVLAVVHTNGIDDITDIAGNCALTSLSGPNGPGYGPYLCGPTFISRRARLNGRQYKYSRFLMYMPNLISQVPVVIQSVKNLLSDMKPAKMTILFGSEYLPKFVSSFSTGSYGPKSLTQDPAGYTYVCDESNGKIQKYNPDGTYNSVFVSVTSPYHVMYYNNLIYVAWNPGGGSPGEVSVYDLTGAHQFDFSGGSTPGLLGGMAADSLGNVYVLDYIYTFVRYYNGATGAYINKFAYVNNTGYLINSGGIAIDPITGNLYIVDANGGQHFVQVWSPYPGAPAHLFDFGTSDLFEPFDIAIDSTGLFHVADAGHNAIKVFDALGVLRYSYGSFGTGPGQFAGTWGIFIDFSDVIYVSDNNNRRIEKFGYNDLVFQEI